MTKEKMMRVTGSVEIGTPSGEINVFGVAESDFKELKKIGRYRKSGKTEWVTTSGITFFKGGD